MTDNPAHCSQHQVQLERLEHIKETLQNGLKAAHRRIDEMETDVTKLQGIITGNGTEGMTMRVVTVEKQIANLACALDKIQQTMTYISRAAWSIIASIGLAALYWIVSELVHRQP